MQALVQIFSFSPKENLLKEVWYYEHTLPEGMNSYSKTNPISIEEFEEEKKWWDMREENKKSWRVGIDRLRENKFNLDIKNPNTNYHDYEKTSEDLMKDIKDRHSKVEELLSKINKIL